MQFVHKAGQEERGIQVASSLAKQAGDAPLFPQPTQGGGQVQLFHAANHHVAGHHAEPSQSAPGGARGRQKDYRREAAVEHRRVFIHGTGAGDDHAQRVLGQSTLLALHSIASGAGAERYAAGFGRSRPAHDRLRQGTEFIQVRRVSGTPERGHLPVRGGYLAVGRHGHVHEDERTPAGGQTEPVLSGQTDDGTALSHKSNMASP